MDLNISGSIPRFLLRASNGSNGRAPHRHDRTDRRARRLHLEVGRPGRIIGALPAMSLRDTNGTKHNYN